MSQDPEIPENPIRSDSPPPPLVTENVFSVRPAIFQQNLPAGIEPHGKTYTSIKELKEYCQYKRELHYICSKYYEKWQYRFQVPSIFITSISGIISFFATSSVFSETSVQFLSLLVGVFASCSAVVQAVSNIFDFGNKASSHEYAVMSYEQILTKIRFMILKGNEDASQNIESIERLIFELKQRVKYITPAWAEQKYKENQHKLKLKLIKMEEKSMTIESKFREKIDLEKLKLELFEKDISNVKSLDDLKKIGL